MIDRFARIEASRLARMAKSPAPCRVKPRRLAPPPRQAKPKAVEGERYWLQSEAQRARRAHQDTRGAKNPNAALTEVDVLWLRYRRAWLGYSGASLARMVGVSPTLVTKICTGQSWTHVGGPLVEAQKKYARRGA